MEKSSVLSQLGLFLHCLFKLKIAFQRDDTTLYEGF